MWDSAKIREAFLNYFEEKGHKRLASSSLVPINDPTLLFVNAGMVQFKDIFIGNEQVDYSTATTSQRCVRAGGKHNDLDQVGYTARHHTFFEMLGNFSFGDYFKREAIQFCWELLTEVYKIPAEKLWVTVFRDDDEAADIWLKEMKVDPARFSRCDEKDNFWSMGETGPCGPCSEIFYDHGEEIFGGPPGSPDQEGDRYVEIWNLVFMQHERFADGSLQDLPKKSVDTGMGLERLAAVLQGVHNNYDTDIFQVLLKQIAKLSAEKDLTKASMRVIADHIRACAFLIVDGVSPSNEGRGYVLRRIIRRAIRHGYSLGIEQTFFFQLVAPLVEQMGAAYPELVKAQDFIQQVLENEEKQFERTLDQGMRLFEQDVANLANKIVPGETIFRLYDTYGFPPDLTGDMARERDLELDMAGFKACMQKQRKQSQAASQFSVGDQTAIKVDSESEFTGYQQLVCEAQVEGLFRGSEAVETLQAGEQGIVILNSTPFYAESGGQVGDQGVLRCSDGEFQVADTKKQNKANAHYGNLATGELHVGDTVNAEVDAQKRAATVLNHSATHLLHAALKKVLGEHVSQKGSLVAPDRLRFDFSHLAPVTREELQTIESLVNEKIRANLPAVIEVMTPEQAKQKGAMALFGEKYGDQVRVLSMGEFSIELCGGTHVNATGDIGVFKIIAETGIASGVRRIEALTGNGALDWVTELDSQFGAITELLKTQRDNSLSKLIQLLEKQRQLEKEMQKMRAKLATSGGQSLTDEVVDVHGVKLLSKHLADVDMKTLRDMLDKLKSQLGSAVIVLAGTEGGRVHLVAGVTKDLTSKLHAGKLINYVAEQVGGKGGGRADMAQAGGTQPESVPEALASVQAWVQQQLS